MRRSSLLLLGAAVCCVATLALIGGSLVLGLWYESGVEHTTSQACQPWVRPMQMAGMGAGALALGLIGMTNRGVGNQ